MYKEIIIMTKSSKRGEYCISGIDTTTGNWIRPISNNIFNEGSVPLKDIIYSDGTEVQILDRVRIEMISHAPTKVQPENYIYNGNKKWVKTGSWTLEEVVEFRGYDDAENVFYNNKKDLLENELGEQGSLLFVELKNAYIFIKTFDDGNKKIQLNFEYNNKDYRYFKISDLLILDKFCNREDGIYYRIDNLQAVISLTDKYHLTNKYYKMVAQIFY